MSALARTLVSAYCRLGPIAKGKSHVRKLGLSILGGGRVEAHSRHAPLRFDLTLPEDSPWAPVLFDGTFETGTLKAIKKILPRDGVTLDIGANLGWYAMHMAFWSGECHAFEPVPLIFSKLRKNCELNGLGKIQLNNLALSNHAGVATMHTFPGEPDGHSSMSDLGHKNFQSCAVRTITLDSYVAGRRISRVDLVKLDVEGAEMLILRGASAFLASSRTTWVIEINTRTSRAFGYKPASLLEFLLRFRKYEFHRVVGGWGKVRLMRSPNDYEHGDNVICIPI